MNEFVLRRNDYTICKAWLNKHRKYMIALFVGLLPVALPLVEKKIAFTVDRFKEFMASVKKVEGPIMPFQQQGHPCALKLIASVQNKIRTLVFKDESDYTQNTNVVIKTTQLLNSALMNTTMDPPIITREQEKLMRLCLEEATMENADRQLKYAVDGKNKLEKQV